MCATFPIKSILNYFLLHSSLSELQFPIGACRSQDEHFQKVSVTEWLRLEDASGDCPVHPPAHIGSPGAGYPEPCLPGFLISPRTETLQPLWTTCAAVQPVKMVLLFLQKQPKETFGFVFFFPIGKLVNPSSFSYLSSPIPCFIPEAIPRWAGKAVYSMCSGWELWKPLTNRGQQEYSQTLASGH